MNRGSFLSSASFAAIAVGTANAATAVPGGSNLVERKANFDSAGFIQIVEQAETTGQDLLFLVGGHDGLPPEWKPRADLLLSLSPMTFPHELARAMLAEQIYRAFTTLRVHPYPR